MLLSGEKKKNSSLRTTGRNFCCVAKVKSSSSEIYNKYLFIYNILPSTLYGLKISSKFFHIFKQ